MLVGRTEGKVYRVCWWAELRERCIECWWAELKERCIECVGGQN